MYESLGFRSRNADCRSGLRTISRRRIAAATTTIAWASIAAATIARASAAATTIISATAGQIARTTESRHLNCSASTAQQ